MKKISSSMGLICLILFAFTVIGCESVPWDMVANSLTTVGNTLQNNYGGGSSGSSGSGTYNMTIVNNTGYTVYFVNVSHSSSDSWEMTYWGLTSFRMVNQLLSPFRVAGSGISG